MVARNFDVELRNLDGVPVKDKDGNPVMLSDPIARAVGDDYEGEKLDFAEKVRRFDLARKILAGGEIDLTAEELVIIKNLCAKGLKTFVVGQIATVLEA